MNHVENIFLSDLLKTCKFVLKTCQRRIKHVALYKIRKIHIIDCLNFKIIIATELSTKYNFWIPLYGKENIIVDIKNNVNHFSKYVHTFWNENNQEYVFIFLIRNALWWNFWHKNVIWMFNWVTIVITRVRIPLRMRDVDLTCPLTCCTHDGRKLFTES